MYLIYFLFFSFLSEASTLRVVTAEFPPFQVIQPTGKVGGITTEIVENVIANAGYQSNIKSYPWARTLKLGMRERDVLIYSIVRNSEREKLFKWIGVLAPYNVYFWKLKKRKDIKLTSIDNVKKYKVGAVNGDIKAQQLVKMGFVSGVNLDFVASDQQNVRRLFAGKIDLMPFDEVSFRYSVATEGLDFSLVEKVIYLDGISHELYLAASLGISDDVVEKLRMSLNAFKKTDKYYRIQKRLK